MGLLTKIVATKATLAGLGLGVAAGLAVAVVVHGALAKEARR